MKTIQKFNKKENLMTIVGPMPKWLQVQLQARWKRWIQKQRRKNSYL